MRETFHEFIVNLVVYGIIIGIFIGLPGYYAYQWYSNPERSDEFKALKLALSVNHQRYDIVHPCEKGWFEGVKVNTSVIITPINKDVIETSMAYKVLIGEYSELQSESLSKQFLNLIEKDSIRLFAMVVNNDILGKGAVSFSDFSNNVQIITDDNQTFRPLAYTRVFDRPMKNGTVTGYVRFKDFAPTIEHLSYTFRVDRITVSGCDSYGYDSFAMAFDDAHFNILSNIQSGISADLLSKTYENNNDLDYNEMMTAINTVTTILSMLIKKG